MLSYGLSIYKGGTNEILKNFLYMLNSTSMLENTESMTVNYPYLDDFFKEFKEDKFKKITKEQYDEMMANIAKVSEYMEDLMNSNMMIQEIIGTGEIAISDHRSSQPTFEEFTRVVADTRLGGVLSGKAGIVNVHLGDSPRCLDLIERVVDETEIPASQILPTHINRNEMLFGKSIEYALKGGAVDFTGNEDIDYWETICDEVRVCNGIKRMLDAGVNPDRMTISSDGQGSLPMYSSDGEFLGMGVGQSSCLLKEVKECVFKTEIPLAIAISTITSNPADILRLKGKGKVEEGYDADLCILDQELQLVEVIAKGNTVYTK